MLNRAFWLELKYISRHHPYRGTAVITQKPVTGHSTYFFDNVFKILYHGLMEVPKPRNCVISTPIMHLFFPRMKFSCYNQRQCNSRDDNISTLLNQTARIIKSTWSYNSCPIWFRVALIKDVYLLPI